VSKSRTKSSPGCGACGPASYVARLVAPEAQARRVADLLAETLDPASAACSAFERADGAWQVDVHFRTRPSAPSLRASIGVAAGARLANKLSIEVLTPRDWVRESLIGLRPVTAGRFVVHGAHDRDRVPSHCIGIEIEASTAFGTGHHGTTRGCLLALDALARRHRPRYVLDLGTGSGVLAIACAKLMRVRVLATDIDPRAVEVARANARRNGVGNLVTVSHAADLRAPEIVRRAPFDLVLSNILLQPLQKLAAPMARQLSPNARVVLSGLLTSQGNAAVAAYRSQGLVLERSFTLDGWVTPVMLALSA
jgi:ribosomal protein L11 methyltransferase